MAWMGVAQRHGLPFRQVAHEVSEACSNNIRFTALSSAPLFAKLAVSDITRVQINNS
ncbi:MAG: hypothetical protein KKB37_12510 [Alphaproteobacteria bacterium]|nr:hypothetical protein [Alphaproteobacteria bacterium]